MEKPSGEFFATLGQYVYKYINDDGEILYTGKGNGDRCWAHVIEKGFNPEHCYIVAKNLEKFDLKRDGASFVIESFLIFNENPENNIVSGHYKECFIMAKLSEYFGKYQAEQLDQFQSLPDWYVENYDSSLKGKLSEVKINSTTFFVKSAANTKVYMMWWYTPSEGQIKVGFELNIAAGQERETALKKLKDWLKDAGYSKPTQDGVDYKMHIMVNDMQEVIQLFDEFNS